MTHTTMLKYDPIEHTYVVLETIRKPDEGEVDHFAEFQRMVAEIVKKADDEV